MKTPRPVASIRYSGQWALSVFTMTLALALSPLACVSDTRVLTGFEISIPIFSSTPPGYLENVKTIRRAALVPLELGCSCLSRGRDAVVAACVIAIFCESLICDSLLHSLLTPICRLDQQKLTGRVAGKFRVV